MADLEHTASVLYGFEYADELAKKKKVLLK
jgi:hypothetical protein